MEKYGEPEVIIGILYEYGLFKFGTLQRYPSLIPLSSSQMKRWAPVGEPGPFHEMDETPKFQDSTRNPADP